MTAFVVKNKEDKEVELDFKPADSNDISEASKVYNKKFVELLDAGGLLRKKLVDKLREQNLWSDAKQKELDDVNKEIADLEHKLHVGGISLSEAKKIAIDLKTKRNQASRLLNNVNEYDNTTIEGQADNARFNYLVYACTVYKDSGQRYFESFENFLEGSDPVAFVASSKYAEEFYGLSELESALPENKFLKKYNFVDDDLRLVNKEGKWVDVDGNLVDEFGNRLDEDGNIVDVFGYKRNKDGEYLEEPKPFFDDNGNEIVDEVDSNKDSTKEVAKTTRKKKTPVEAT